MALPSAFSAALAQPRVSVDLWLEIEGIGYAFGLTQRAGSFFAARTATERRLGTIGSLVEPPRGVDQRVRPLDGNSSIGELEASLLFDAAGQVRALVAGSHRTDNWLFLMAPEWEAEHAYSLHDVVWRLDLDGTRIVARCSTAGTTAPAGSGVYFPTGSTLLIQHADGSTHQASLIAGYYSFDDACTEVKRALDAMAVGTFTVTHATGTISITDPVNGWRPVTGSSNSQWSTLNVFAWSPVPPYTGIGYTHTGTAAMDLTDNSGWPSGLAVGGVFSDGSAAWTVLSLGGDLGATGSETVLFYSGTADAAQYPTGGGTLYIGRETFTYTSRTAGTNGAGYFSGVTRGMYALPGRPAKDSHLFGDVVSPYPRFLATRRTVLMATVDGTDANRLARWGGTIRGAKAGGNLTTLEVTMQSIDGDLSVRAFATQRSAKLYAGLADGLGAYEPASEDEPAFETTRLRFVTESLAGDWTVGEKVMVVFGDEVVAGTVGSEDGITHLTLDPLEPRGLFGTEIVAHPVGEEVKEIIWTGAYRADGSAIERHSRFTQGDGPLSVVLSFLLSRNGDGANGPYDVLPPGWGVGIPQARVDVAGIERLQTEWLGAVAYRWIYLAPFTLKAEIAEILKPHMCFPLAKLDDLLTIKRLSPPIPSTTLRTINASAIVGIPSWDANVLEVIGRTRFLCDFDPFLNEHRQVFIGEMQGAGLEAQEFYSGLYKTLEIAGRGLYTGNDPAASFFGARLNTGATSAAERYTETIRDRYARPFPLIGVRCSYDYLDVEVGDLVSLSLANVPNTATGGEGLDGAICEVFSKTIDDLTGTVSLGLAHTATMPRYRLVAPSGSVSSTATGTITLVDGIFNPTGGNRTDGFAVGDVIRVLSSDLTTVRGTATLTGTTATALQMATVPAGTVAGDVVLLAAYTSQPAATKARCAFLADTSDLLGGVDPAHVFAS